MIDYDFDWAEIRKLLKEKEPPAGGVPNLLIDEGQDLPVTFFVIAAHLAQHLTVFADENQRLNNEQSTLAEIREAISPTGEYALERNYRNTQKIAAVAAHFYPGGPTGIPKPPLERPAGRSVQLRRFDDVDAVSTMVANLAQSRAQDQIGVFVPTKDLVHEYVDALMEHDVPVQWYLSGAGQQVDFTDSGVFVTTWQSAKGLEFDQVFVSELQSMFFPRNTESRMRLYVLASRARDRLVFAYTGPGKLAFDSLFPGDVERVP
jgi:superfamily I DNA/RNA helicase